MQQTIKVNTRTNHQRWVKLLCSTVFDENNKPIKAIGIAQDITDEKNLEQLYRQERQYRDSLIFEAMGAFEVNLTQDMITQINTPWPGMLDVSKTKTYSQWLGAVSYTHLDVYKRQWLPCSKIRPSPITRMRSASRMVERRWAIKKLV